MAEITTKDMETIDLTLWRAGRREPGAVEAALDANYGLAARPPVMPPRVAIAMPPVDPVRIVRTVKLWE